MQNICIPKEDVEIITNTVKNIRHLLSQSKPSAITMEEFIVLALKPDNICYSIMNINIECTVNEMVTSSWGIKSEKNIGYLLDSISMLFYNRLIDTNSGIRKLWMDAFIVEAFESHPAQMAIIAAQHHTPTSLIIGSLYDYWQPLEEDAFFIVDGSVVISDLVNQEEAEELEPYLTLFNCWDEIERELVIKMLNKALSSKTLLELLTTIRDSICIGWIKNTKKSPGYLNSNNLVFKITFHILKNVI